MTADAESVGWDTVLYEGSHSFVWKSGGDLLELLDVKPGERVLDLGCGTGHLAAAIASRGAEVVGIDNSPSMIEQARKSYPHLHFEMSDGRWFAFPEKFDAVFSNAALHWMLPPGQVVECVRDDLRPGARFVAEFGGKGNVEAVLRGTLEALRTLGYDADRSLIPWYFPNISEYATLLEQHGLEVRFAALLDRPTRLEDGEEGLRNWLRMFALSLLAAAPADSHEALLGDIEHRLRPHLFRDGSWYADYRRLRVLAVREG